VAILEFLYWLLTFALLPFFAFLALTTAAALFGRRGAAVGTGAVRPVRFLFVIPAHNEEGNIVATVVSCHAVAYDPAFVRVCVIADNCTDATARVAREAGATVVERHDPVRSSKGYALEYFFQHLEATGQGGSFDAAVVIDADSVVAPDMLEHFARTLAEGADWAQCYDTVSNPETSWRTRLLTYAFSLINGIWPLGEDRLGVSAGLRGNGMLFTARGLQQHPWNVYGLAEDHEFSWTLRVAGARVRFVPEARVYADMVSTSQAAAPQRRRWEQGRSALRAKFFRPLLASPALPPLHKALLLIELLFPPMMRLLALLALALTVHLPRWLDPAATAMSRRLLPIHLTLLMILAAYAVAPCLALGVPWKYLLDLRFVPYYAVWKLICTARSRTTAWVRTAREPREPPIPRQPA
jgi:1,2-diacylglycerol 3-beta-glucosyltransferase